MKAYENGAPAYFATPPVNLIRAFHASLTQITRREPSLEKRLQLHREAAQRVRSAAAELGLALVPTDLKYTANGMTAVSLATELDRPIWVVIEIVCADLLAPGPWCGRSRSSLGSEGRRYYRWYSQGV